MTKIDTSSAYENRLTGERFQVESQCIESIFSNHQQLIESFYPSLGLHNDGNQQANKFLYCTDLGVARLPLKKVHWQA